MEAAFLEDGKHSTKSEVIRQRFLQKLSECAEVEKNLSDILQLLILLLFSVDYMHPLSFLYMITMQPLIYSLSSCPRERERAVLHMHRIVFSYLINNICIIIKTVELVSPPMLEHEVLLLE